jgi:deoxyuridine 5'-triphosphate nucleotidohydrolase
VRRRRIAGTPSARAQHESSAPVYPECSAEDTVIPARGKGVVKTDLAIAIPAGTYARVAPRSGLAAKHFIDTGAGVIDEDYRGNVGVVLFNHAETEFQSEWRGRGGGGRGGAGRGGAGRGGAGRGGAVAARTRSLAHSSSPLVALQLRRGTA